MVQSSSSLTRRALAAGAASLALSRAAKAGSAAAGATGDRAALEWRILTASPARRRLRPDASGESELWAFDPDPGSTVLRIRHGEEVRVRLVNRTPRALSLHWHGVRNVNAMDGLGGLTQRPVEPGETFEYRFTPPDPGTFLLRPLVVGGSSEPAERGLSGLLIVEERERLPVDDDVPVAIDDWRLGDDGTLAPFGDPVEAASAGRLGNWLTVNGRAVPHAITAAPGARLRLRLANACNARSFRVRFDGLRTHVAAIDGQPTDTFEPLRSTLPLAPGTRYDVLVDVPREAGAPGAVTALLAQGVPLITIAAAAGGTRPAPPPPTPLGENRRLPPAIPLQRAARRDVVIGGGARLGPDGRPLYRGDPARIWTVNGAPGSASAPPLVSVKRGSPVVLALKNQTQFVQPLHLHGHVCRLLHVADDGWEPFWLDTLQVPEGRTLHIAFIADNPGRWALSSTVLERFDAGLWTWFEVT